MVEKEEMTPEMREKMKNMSPEMKKKMMMEQKKQGMNSQNMNPDEMAEKMKNMSPEQRKKMMEQKMNSDSMNPGDMKNISEEKRMKMMESMPPEKRKQMMENMSPEMKQKMMMEKMKDMTPAQRKEKMKQVIAEDDKKMEVVLKKYGVDKKKIMIAMLLSLFVDVLGYSMLLPLLPGIAKVMSASDFMVGIVIAANSFMAMIFAPMWGKISDKYGRKKILQINQIGTLFSFIVLASANSIEIILLARILDGMFGGQYPVIKSIGSDITTHRTRMHTMMKIMSGVMVGMILGPAIGGLLGSGNWRYPVYFAIFLATLSFIFTYIFLNETMPKERIADIKAHMKKMNEKSKLWTRKFKTRLSQIFLMNFAFIVIATSLPLVLLKRFGSTPQDIGLLMSFNGIMMFITMVFGLRKFGKNFEPKHQITFAIIMLLSGYFMYSFLSAYWMFFILLAVLTIGNVFSRPLTQTSLLKAAPLDQQGAASGWGTNIQSLAESIAPVLAMWYLQIGGASLGSINITSYTLIGVTAFLISLIFAIIVFWDIKTHNEDF